MGNRAVLDRLVEAYNRDDVEGVVADGTADVEYVIRDLGVHLVGREQWLGLVRMIATGVPGRRMTVLRRAVDGDVGVLEWILEGTSSGQVPGFPPTGEQFRREGCSVIEFRDARIARWRDYVDAVQA